MATLALAAVSGAVATGRWIVARIASGGSPSSLRDTEPAGVRAGRSGPCPGDGDA